MALCCKRSALLVVTASVLALAASLLWPGGSGQAQTSPLFRAEANLVPIEVQALEGDTRQPAAALSCEDFVVLDESRPTEIVACDQGGTARDILLLLDLSGGVADEGVQFVAPAIVRVLRPEDRAAVMWFSDGEALLSSSLTSDPDEVDRALRDTFIYEQQHGGRSKHSRLLDAILSGAEFLSENSDGRRPLIIVVTHNRDGGSKAEESEVVEALLRSSISLEAVTIPQQKSGWSPGVGGGVLWNSRLGFPGGKDNRNKRGRSDPQRLDNLYSIQPIAARVGGQVVHLDLDNARRVPAGQPNGREWDINSIALIVRRELLNRIRTSFVLSIRGVSTPERQFRRLQVKLTEQARRQNPDTTLWFRAGYFTHAGQPEVH